MKLSSLILVIIKQLDGERSIYSSLHLLRGKRSGQTLQDVEYYSLKRYFGILPKLRIDLFDEAVEELMQSAYIVSDNDSIVHLTEKGREVAEIVKPHHFNGWDYRGRELIFYERLSLVVQTISNFKSSEKSFMPIQKSLDVQQFVKKVLAGLPIGTLAFSHQTKEELKRTIEYSQMTDRQKVILTHRLAGYKITGWTWDQLASRFHVSPMSIYLDFIESLHLLLKAIDDLEGIPLLRKITESIKVTSYLTDSSQKTKMYFEKGLSIEEIALKRRLKMSTIEDHFVEISINDLAFPIEQFVSKEDLETVIIKVDELGTKRLRLLKDEFPKLNYFQLRLILGAYNSEGGG